MIELLTLFLAPWVAYLGIMKGGYVSDDVEGIQNYDGKFRGHWYGGLQKWLFFKILGKDVKANHSFLVFLHSCNTVLLYTFLSTIIPLNVAFVASLLFAVHPVNVQSVAWMSGRGYPISLLFSLMTLNLTATASASGILANPNSWQFIGFLLLYAVLYQFAVQANFAAMFMFTIVFFMGQPLLALVGMAIAIVLGYGVVKEVILIRKKTFEEQDLGKSTTLNLRKIIVVLKTLYYYTKLTLLPKRLGLYHVFCYHYDDKVEKDDRYSWAGLLILAGALLALVYGNTVVRIGVLWYLSFIWVFLNWITIHQFVSERYLYSAVPGLCILIAYVLQPFPLAIAFLVGLALMRVWTHLPSYHNEVNFYLSNVWNFPQSEVAFSNLGVVYMKNGMIGSAIDAWMISTQINKDYDVGYYNISSIMKQQNNLQKAHEFLKKAVDAKLCHFKKQWSGELQALEHEMDYIRQINELNVKLIELDKRPECVREMSDIKAKLAQLNNLHNILTEQNRQQIQFIEQENSSLQVRMVQLQQQKEAIQKSATPENMVAIRDTNFKIILDEVNKLYANSQPRISS